MTRARAGIALVAALLILTLSGAGAAAAAAPSVSFTQAQQQFMCTICHEPLYEAHSGEAIQENGQLRQLIAHGDRMPEIKRQMVAQYGVAVLAVPPAHGFSLLVFVVPGVIIVLGIAVLAYTIPHWRGRATAQQAGAGPAASPPISDEDARRLDAELARQR